jgi:hypothetical protein
VGCLPHFAEYRWNFCRYVIFVTFRHPGRQMPIRHTEFIGTRIENLSPVMLLIARRGYD